MRALFAMASLFTFMVAVSAAGGAGVVHGSALSGQENNIPSPLSAQSDMANEQKVTLGAGCFWCVEAVFKRVDGVTNVVSGYSGGRKDEASYRIVKSGGTNHAEVVQVTFDPDVISFDAILRIFWRTHDPTTLNRQGADVGPQYRSVIFYHDDLQRERAEHFKEKLDESGIFDDPIVTEITPLEAFYEAEEYHQNYFERNPDQGYCQIVIRPKIDKFKILFEEKLRDEYRP